MKIPYKLTVPTALRSLPLAILAALPGPAFAQKRPFTVDDMLAMERLSDPSASPDGKWIVFSKRVVDVEANAGRNDLWIVASDGRSAPRPLTTHPASDTSGRFSSDSKFVYFLSNRGGSTQVWRIAVDGGEAESVTACEGDIGCFVLFPGEKQIAVTLEVYPGTTPAETAKREAVRASSKVTGLVYDQLLFRHWDSFEDGRRSHVFVFTKGGGLVDLMKEFDADSPTHPFGGAEEIAVSPDGKYVVFASKVVGREAAWSTNVDLWIAPADGSTRPQCLTSTNKAFDNLPSFSPDGGTLAYVAMKRPGFEADRQVIMLLDRATREARALTEAWDRSAGSLTWSADGKTLYTTADNVGNKSLFAIQVADGAVRTLVEKGSNDAPCIAGDRVVFLHDNLHAPAELFSVPAAGGETTAITRFNGERCAAIDWSAFEQFSFTGAKDETVYGYIMKPAGFDESKKYPIAFLVHGGPQGSFGNHFHYRWNPAFYSGRGYAAVFIDFHGSTGYGQNFTDSIRGDWGGAPYTDLMKGLDEVGRKYAWADTQKAAALGASYGGYMMNWIAGQTDRFKCIVTHASNIDERMAYYNTEELWFPEWEHGGTPWDNPEGYTKHNPIDFVKNWKTPTLVTHGALDFRVVDTQGMSVFTALQRKGVPSRLLYFPNENHWILKPQNSRFWHQEVGRWLDQWCKAGN